MTAALVSSIASAIMAASMLIGAIRIARIDTKVDRLTEIMERAVHPDPDMLLHEMRAAMDRARDMGMDL